MMQRLREFLEHQLSSEIAEILPKCSKYVVLDKDTLDVIAKIDKNEKFESLALSDDVLDKYILSIRGDKFIGGFIITVTSSGA